jgi:hypothetical protein
MHPLFKPTHLLAVAGFVCGAAAQAAVVTPATLGNWSAFPFGGGSTSISTTVPRSGSGSIEITLPTSSAGADWVYELATPVKLSTFTSGAYEYWRDSASTVSGIQVPVYGLWIDNDCDTATTADQAYLVYEPYYQTPSVTAFPTNQWVSETITPANVVWPIGGGMPWSTQPLSSYMNGTAAGTTITGSSCIMQVVPFAGSGWAGAFHGAIDNVRLTAGGAELVNANFEPSPPATPVAVPTLSQWGLALMVLLLGALGFQRSRRATSKV